ncbi:hypothetical protein [Tenacibaculum sp. 190524A02b]|uniref:hypothetical protein n=1 Tax=Tenacibaculum vairaonense TaxID=3137860 RepID=UPI0031FB2EBF
MKITFTIITLFVLNLCYSQTIINWSPDYQLSLNDFNSPQTEINDRLNTYSISSGAQIDFSFQMSSYAFMFTKNFNKKVKTILNKNAAVIVAPDSIIANRLVKLGQYEFDAMELYARRFRKELYEKKKAFSGASFFQPIYNELQNQMNAENARVIKATEAGKDEELLKQEHKKVLKEINELSDFCYSCKPTKKRKKKRKKKE